MRDELIERLARRVDPVDPVGAAERLRRLPELHGDLTWLQHLLDAAEQLPLPAVPPEVTAGLQDLFSSRHEADVRVESATIVHDSRRPGTLAGVRGEHQGQGWTMLYSAPSADVIVDGEEHGGGGEEISGQILDKSGDARVYRIEVSGPENRSALTDDAGQFAFGPLASGAYEVAARRRDVVVTWSMTVGAG